jgi:hypothetical protein
MLHIFFSNKINEKWIESNLQNKEHIKSRKQALIAAASKLRKIGLNSKDMSMEVKAFLFDTYCRSTTQYGLSCNYLTQKDVSDLAILEGKILKVAFGLTKYHSTSMLLHAIKLKPLEKLIKIRKLQTIQQLMGYELTADIINKQLTENKRIPCKSFTSDILRIIDEPINEIDDENLSEKAKTKIAEMNETTIEEQNSEKAIAVNYLLRNNNKTNYEVVKKLLSWENRVGTKQKKKNNSRRRS